MAFRVKSTHDSLKSLRQAVTDKPTPTTSKRYTEEKKYDYPTTTKKSETKPKTGSSSGIAIRSIPSAQSDHM